MPTYPSNLNGPSTTVNNLTDLREMVNPVGANGEPDITDPTKTYDDVATALNLLLVELFQVKNQFIGTYNIADPTGVGVTTNANITATEQAYIAAHFGLKLHYLTTRALSLAREIQNIQADINTAVGASGAQAPVGVTPQMPSDFNRGW
jgi:hypothetical protein